MDKEKVIEYVMHSPYNTNRAVLSTLLDEGESSESFATVTFKDINIAVDARGYTVTAACCSDEESTIAIVHSLLVTPSKPATLKIPLYKGTYTIKMTPVMEITGWDYRYDPVLEGSVSSGSNGFEIKGDCTISLTSETD